MQTATPLVHLVDDDDDLRHALAQGLELEGVNVAVHDSAASALERITHEAYAVLVTDIRMPGMDGMALLKAALSIDPTFPVILITGHGDVQMAVDAMRAGAYDFIEKPFQASRLYTVIDRALEKRRLVLENRTLRSELDGHDALSLRLVGRTQGIVRLREQIAMLADTDVDVLVRGETGAGKEVVARALHDTGGRAKGNFVAINCAAVPADMIEAELFGHEAGAFTGASKQRIGKLEHADGGTVFLDEISEISPQFQVALLRFLQEGEVKPLGSDRVLNSDVRIISASNKSLEKRVEQGRFRRDLYYRLRGFILEIPPLRERPEDIPVLTQFFVEKYAGVVGRRVLGVASDVVRQLEHYSFPGNVRELETEVQRMVAVAEQGGYIALRHLSDKIRRAAAPEPRSAGWMPEGATLKEKVESLEKMMLKRALAEHHWNQSRVAEELGLSRVGLANKIKRYGLRRDASHG